MNASAQPAVTSFEALLSTVRTDYSVYSWFAYLIQLPAVRESLASQEDTGRRYRLLDGIVRAQTGLYGILWGVVLAFALTGMSFFAGAGLLLVAAGFWLHVKKRKTVVSLCSELFARDFEASRFSEKTLYQIGEFYGQRYGIPSLVDTIAFSDKAGCIVFAAVLFVTCLVHPLNPAYLLLLVCAAFYVVRASMSRPFIYKYIK